MNSSLSAAASPPAAAAGTAAAIAPEALSAIELGVAAPRVARLVAPLAESAEARGRQHLLAVRGPADEVRRLVVAVALGDEEQRAAGGAGLALLEGAARPRLRRHVRGEAGQALALAACLGLGLRRARETEGVAGNRLAWITDVRDDVPYLPTV